jgi:archaellum component FlaC
MPKVIITESQYNKLLEQGSNSAAMDLDIYTQPTQIDTDNGNLDVIDASEEIINTLEELISMFKGGKKTNSETKHKIYRGLDNIKDAHSEIKYEK